MESEEEEEDNNAAAIPSEELNLVIRDLTASLENLKTCFDLISKHGSALQRALMDLESGEDVAARSKLVSERATLFRISANAMKNACSDYLQTAQTQGNKWSKMLEHERAQRLHLEEIVEQLARQHSHLEQAANRHRPGTSKFSRFCVFCQSKSIAKRLPRVFERGKRGSRNQSIRGFVEHSRAQLCCEL